MTIAATLRLLEPEIETSSWFCGHCGFSTAGTDTPASRVCTECESGLMLQTSADAAPSADDAFLVIDSSLTVQALSRHAETALGVPEANAVNRHVTELLIPGDVESQGGFSLAAAIVRAAGGSALGTVVAVRPSRTFGVRRLARITACGPPAAALVVLELPASAR